MAKRRTEKQLAAIPMVDWTEDEWQAWVCKQAERRGWHVIEYRRAFVKERGKIRMITPTSKPWVDVTLIRPPRIMHLELKAERGTIYDTQVDLMRRLQACPGNEAAVVFPHEADALLRRLDRDGNEVRPDPPQRHLPLT